MEGKGDVPAFEVSVSKVIGKPNVRYRLRPAYLVPYFHPWQPCFQRAQTAEKHVYERVVWTPADKDKVSSVNQQHYRGMHGRHVVLEDSAVPFS